MRHFLEAQGFNEVKLDGTVELVYGKIVAKSVCLRVYTSVVYGESRAVGLDAIRVCLVARKKDGIIVGIGRETRVNRIGTWKKNLQARIDKHVDLMTPPCPICGENTKERDGKYGKFAGCIAFPICRGLTKLK